MASPTPTIAEIVEKFGGELHGPGSVRIRQVATLRNAGADQLAFFAGGAYASDLAVTRAGVVVLKPDAVDKTPQPRIVVANPYVYFARVSQWLNPPDAPAAGIHATAIVDPSAMIHASASIGPLVAVGARSTIGANTVIGAGSVIGDDCELGDDTCLYPRVTLYSRTRVGRRGIVHSGVVLGADGFGFANERGAWIKIPQIGGVSIGDDVEIGANTTIDRGALDDTVIEDGVKLDNQIQIGHNCRVGAHTAIAGCVGVAGSTSIGRYCMIGGASSISGHISIVDRVIIAGATSVAKSISEPGTYAGAWPFTNQRRWRRIAVQVRNIVELESRVKALERARSIRPPEPGNNDNN